MMRDKLVKTGHFAWYYRLRKAAFVGAFTIAVGLISIVPVQQITLEIQNLHAQQTSEVVSDEPVTSDLVIEEDLLSL